MVVFKEELQKGQIIEAYQGLMAYFRQLRTHFEKSFPDFDVPGNIYYGYLDMTYFSILPPFLKSRGLKVAVVFVYDTFRFEVWLSGRNRGVQVEISHLIQKHSLLTYQLTPNPEQADSILDHILVGQPDFSDLKSLTAMIEHGTRGFMNDLEQFFSKLPG
jgi:hypothetical protein